jgi:hypothetical protein
MATMKEIIFKGELAALLLKYQVGLNFADGQLAFVGPEISLRLNDLYRELNS